VLGWHDAVLARPDHQGGAVEAAQAFGGVEQEMGVRQRHPQHAHGVAPDPRLPLDGQHPPRGGGVAAFGEPAERDRQPSHRPQPHLPHEQPEQPGRQPAGEREGAAGQARRDVVERVARGEHDPADAVCAVARPAHEQLDERAAGVVADKGDLTQVEAVEELRDEPGHAWQ
jgi:hypothetical protein